MNRHEQRKKIFQIIFQKDHDLVDLEKTAFFDLYEDHEYIKRIVDFYMARQSDVDADISAHLNKYTLERIPKVDRNILRTAMSEIREGDSPERVVDRKSVV